MRTLKRALRNLMLYVICAIAISSFYNFKNNLDNADGTLQFDYYKVQFDNEEGALFYQTVRLAQGKSIYIKPASDNCVPNVYPPVYFYVASLFTGKDYPILSDGRVVSGLAFYAIFFSILIVAFFSRGSNRTWRRCIIFSVAPLLCMTYEFPRWSGFFRVDMLALAFSFVGLVIFYRATLAKSHLRYAWFVVALILFLLGFYTKQTMLAAPLAATLYLVFHPKTRKAGFVFGGSFAVLLVAIFALLCAVTDGQFYWLTVTANTNTFVVNDVWIWCRHLWNFYKYLLLGAASIAVLAHCAKGLRLTNSPWLLYLLCSVPGVVAIGKAGSAENYLLEFILALVVFSCFTLHDLTRRLAPRYMPLLLIPAGLIFGVHTLHIKELLTRIRPLNPPDARGVAAWNSLANRIRIENQQGRKTWCEPASLNVMAGAPVYYQPFLMAELTRQGKADSNAFINALRNREFSVIVTLCDIFNAPDSATYLPETVEAIRENYTLDASYGRQFRMGPLHSVYVYKAKP